MKIYQIDSSARKIGSTSRALAKKLLEKIKNLCIKYPVKINGMAKPKE